MIWTDPTGLEWDVVDWRIVRDKRKRVELGSWESEGRAFVPYGREGDVMLFEFGRVAYRDTADRTLADQFRSAKPVSVDAARRYWGA